jgi:tetratricopeptide (TPR) repeat protein
MKWTSCLILTLALVAQGVAQQPEATDASTLSPAQRSMAVAQKMIDKSPKDYEAYNALALALSRRARETSDVRYYDEAETALLKSFAIAPGNFDGQRTHVWLLLGKHEFAAALEEAKKLNRKMPDDVMTYGFLTDANVELGNYHDAEEAADWMLKLRPGNLPGLTRAAYLRELYGNVDGSLELMQMAFDSTPPTEVEDCAWILTQMAHLKLNAGHTADADKLLTQALDMFPGYHYALGNLAKLRIQQGRYNDAVALLQQRYEAAQHAENLFDLAAALQLAGRSDEAAAAFASFEKKSLAETYRADNSNHELIFYYADYTRQPAKALAVAQREIARRQDVFTLDAYAWALYGDGQYREAQMQIEKALAVGIQNATMFRHAGEIELKCGNHAAAIDYLQRSTQLNSTGSEQAKQTLAQIIHDGGKQ